MLIETRLDDETSVFIDVEVAGGFARGEEDYGFDPNEIIDNVVKVSSAVARKLAQSQHQDEQSAASPSRVTLEFGLKVDSNSVVSVARSSRSAHFRVQAEWHSHDGD